MEEWSCSSLCQKLVSVNPQHSKTDIILFEGSILSSDGLRGETSIAELCRREGIAQNLYYRWSKDFLESGKRRLDGDTMREANTSEVQKLKRENAQLKEVVAELILQYRVL